MVAFTAVGTVAVLIIARQRAGAGRLARVEEEIG